MMNRKAKEQFEKRAQEICIDPNHGFDDGEYQCMTCRLLIEAMENAYEEGKLGN